MDSRHDDTVNIAAWTAGGDFEREIPNTDAALNEGAAALGRAITIDQFASTDIPSLEAVLADAEVLLFYENEGASNVDTVTSWAPSLANFVDEGGIVVFLGWNEANIEYLDASGLMSGVTLVASSSGEAVVLSLTDHPLLRGVASAITPNGTGSVAVAGDVVSVADAHGGSVLASRSFR